MPPRVLSVPSTRPMPLPAAADRAEPESAADGEEDRAWLAATLVPALLLVVAATLTLSALLLALPHGG